MRHLLKDIFLDVLQELGYAHRPFKLRIYPSSAKTINLSNSEELCSFDPEINGVTPLITVTPKLFLGWEKEETRLFFFAQTLHNAIHLKEDGEYFAARGENVDLLNHRASFVAEAEKLGLTARGVTRGYVNYPSDSPVFLRLYRKFKDRLARLPTVAYLRSQELARTRSPRGAPRALFFFDCLGCESTAAFSLPNPLLEWPGAPPICVLCGKPMSARGPSAREPMDLSPVRRGAL
ncbi:MAG: hypothetical protein LBO66_00680 [Deltaproteobacteria bacterium]|jgi:hypothetical protein|nr:hypothetical protein [Deltaproteobacteria bacterium]